ncbi:MAG: hypothetical protein ACHP7N_08850 [Caulobacterales bacterium]
MGTVMTHTALEAGVVEDVAVKAWRARGVFATRAQMDEWLACVIRRRLRGVSMVTNGRCNPVAAMACALCFAGECPFSSAARELDEIMGALPTPRLEALLKPAA